MRFEGPPSSTEAPVRPAQTARSVADASWDGGFGGWLALAVIGVVAVVLLVHRTALDAGFVFDDRARIVEMESSIDQLWPPSAWMQDTQRPVVRFTLALNYAIGGLEPRGYHAFNLGVHAVSAALVVLVIVAAGRRLREREAIGLGDRGVLAVAVASALLWACHPVQTATATYVIQRAESLAALFSLLAMLALLHGVRSTTPRRWWALVIVSIVLAVASKPAAVVLPAVLLAIDAAILTGSCRAAWHARRALHLTAVAATIATLLATGALLGLVDTDGRRSGAGAGVVGVGPLDYAWSQVRAIGVYGRVAVDPSAMRIDHGAEALLPAWTPVVGVALLLATAAVTGIGATRRAWWIALPILLVLVLLPTTSIVPLADPVADHRLHLALLPVVVALVAAVVSIGRPLGRVVPGGAIAWWSVAVIGLLVTLVADAAAIGRRNADYADPARLWAEVLESRPDHVRGLVNRAAASLDAGDDEAAARDLAAAADIEPGNPVLLVNLAILDLRLDRPESALERLAVAERARPRDPALHAARGDALRSLGRSAEAIAAYESALAIQPSDAILWLALGNARTDLEQLDEAAEAFATAAATAVEPRLVASARFNEGNMRYRQDRLDEAIVAYEAALAADPDHAAARQWLGHAREDRDG